MYENNFLTLVDSHIHIYDCYDLKHFFNSAFRNFSLYNAKFSKADNFIGVLFLTEANDYNFFKAFYDEPEKYSEKINYEIKRTSEESSLRISYNGNIIFLIAGQQIVTEENLEVLAIGTTKRFSYDKSIFETISLVIDNNAIPVLPWGVGKWMGKRAEVIKELISKRSDFFLGDNGNRPAFWSIPGIFKSGEFEGIYNLPGSDPLNFKSEENKPGSFGFYFNDRIDQEYPSKDLKQKILEHRKFKTYGKPEMPFKFFLNQLNIQINKKLRK
jgi:hypothetical protein